MTGLEQNNALVLPLFAVLVSVLAAVVISLRSKTDEVQKENLRLQRELMALGSKVDSQEMTIHDLIDRCASLEDELRNRGQATDEPPKNVTDLLKLVEKVVALEAEKAQGSTPDQGRIPSPRRKPARRNPQRPKSS